MLQKASQPRTAIPFGFRDSFQFDHFHNKVFSFPFVAHKVDLLTVEVAI